MPNKNVASSGYGRIKKVTKQSGTATPVAPKKPSEQEILEKRKNAAARVI